MKNSQSIKAGMFFGMTSAVITTLGLLVGLAVSTDSKMVVIGGLITIAVCDALSDAMGMHLSQESDPTKSAREVWIATFSTLATKFLFAASFVVPVYFLDLTAAIMIDILWGMLVLFESSYLLAKHQQKNPTYIVLEHFALAAVVILISYQIGLLVKTNFS